MLELAFLLIVENGADCIHVTGETCDRQIGPAMASGDVLQTSVLAGGVVESNPTGEVSQRLSARPVRIVLMPGHDATVMRRLAEELIVPEANGSAQKLHGRDREGRMPQDVVKTGRDPPCAEGMEQHMIGITRLVRVVFVKQVPL